VSGLAGASAPRTNAGYLFQTHIEGHIFPQHRTRLSVVHRADRAIRVSGVVRYALHDEALFGWIAHPTYSITDRIDKDQSG
jgi:hypothetical protein